MLHFYETGKSEVVCDKCKADRDICKRAKGRYAYGFKGRKQDDLCESCVQELLNDKETVVILKQY